jgi:thiazole/oxazole-forming peptide maturase SagD family component
MKRWFESRFTGLFIKFGKIEPRPHDPAVKICAGTTRTSGGARDEMNVGGAGWTWDAAEAACVGEAIERLQPQPLARDGCIEASFRSWPIDEPAVAPERCVLFHAEQYAQQNFPFRPLKRATECSWVCFREASSGLPWWVPEEFAFMNPPTGMTHQICPGISTGLSCGKWGQPVLLRGLQEIIERDGIVGAWWGTYPLEEWDAEKVFNSLESSLRARLERPNLRWRFYRVGCPFSAHVTMASIEGEDHEGFCFSIGSACRETREQSWNKAILEAIQGRHYVRRIKRERGNNETLSDFPDHAVYYSVHPEQLAETVLHRPRPAVEDHADERRVEVLQDLVGRLGRDCPVLARAMTPPGIAEQKLDWQVLRVLVPGMQPLHGNDAFAHLGGPLWSPRGLSDWRSTPPHPFA